MSEKTETAMIELVAKACRILGKLDMTHAALGHVSYRLGDSDTMLIKGKGPDEVGLRYTQPEDILVVDFKADKLSGAAGLTAPSESFLHLWLYKKNPEVRSVIHMHPKHAVLLTICEKEILPIYGSYGLGGKMAAEGVPVYPRSVTVHDDMLGEEFAEFMGKKKVALMRGHGVSVVGNGVEDATMRTQTLGELVSMTYEAYAIGQPKPIMAQEIEDMRKPAAEHRARGSAGGETGMLARWRYYCSLTGEA